MRVKIWIITVTQYTEDKGSIGVALRTNSDVELYKNH